LRQLRYSIEEKKYEDSPDGGFVIRDATLLAAGTWTDSGVKTPLKYNENTLEKYAGNWRYNTVWSRHNLGVSRDVITDKIGEVKEPRYDPNVKAIIGDIYLHGKNSKSRDAIEMYKAGLVKFASVEHGGEEAVSSDGTLEAKTLEFYGLALVEKGACAACLLEDMEMAETEKPVEEPKENNMLEETNALLRQLGESLASMKEEVKTSIKNLEDKVRELEEKPEEPVTEAVEETEPETRELEEPTNRIFRDKNDRLRRI